MSDSFIAPNTPNVVDGNVHNRPFTPDVGGRLRVKGRRERKRRQQEADQREQFRTSIGLPVNKPVADPNAPMQVKDLLPEEDISPQAIRRRETIEFETARDELTSARRGPEEAVTLESTAIGSAMEVSRASGISYSREKRYESAQEKFADIWRRRGRDLAKFPTIARAVAEAQANGADISEEDVIRTLNFAEVDRAANMIVADAWDSQRVANILLTADEVTRAAIMDVIPEKLEQLQDSLVDLETADSNVVIDAAGRYIGGALGGIFTVWEKGQQLFRAFGYRDPELFEGDPMYEVGGLFVPLRAAINWNKVASGQFNEEYIQSIRDSGQYSDLEIDIILDIALAGEEGAADPLGDAIQRYSDDPEANQVLRKLIYRYLEDPRLMELVRQVDSAKLGSTGQLFISSLTSFDDDYTGWRGTKTRGTLANASSVFWAFAADPIIVGAAARQAFLAAKFSMQNLTGTQNVNRALASNKIGGYETNRFRAYVERFTGDLKKLDQMQAEASNLARTGAGADRVAKARGDAASFRNMITRQYKEFPEDVIETFRKANIRSVDDFGQFVKDGNNAMLVLRGDAPNLADTSQLFGVVRKSPGRGGPQPVVDFATLGERLTAVGYMGRRAPMVPRLSIGRELRQQFVRAVPAPIMPSRRGREVVATFYQGTDDIDDVARILNEHYDKIGVIDQAGGPLRWAELMGLPGGTLGKMLDTTFRRFASVPNKTFVYTGDARDAKTFYQFSRQYFTKYHATYLTDVYRAANEGQRRLMMIGLIRAAASSRGVNLSKSQAVGKVNSAAESRGLVESLTTGGADDLFAPQVIQTATGAPARISQYGDDIQTALSEGGEVLLNPSSFNGRQHALHLAQTTPYVSIPTPGMIESLRWWKANAPSWIQKLENSPQAATDFWSLFTLVGFRYSQRNMVEDLWMYMMTAGRMGNLWSGRRMSTALRDARPGFELKKNKAGKVIGEFDESGNFIPEIIEKQRVGMFAKKSRDFGNWLRRNDTTTQRSLGTRTMGLLFLGSVADEKTLAAAYLAAKNGNFVPMQKLAVTALTRQRLTGIGKTQADDLGDLVLNPMGLKLLDDVAETGRYISQGAFPARLAPVQGTDVPGVITYAVPEKAPTVGGKFVSVQPTDPNGSLYWFRSINSVVDYDGPIGRLAIQNLNDRAKATELIAKAIREDKDIGYLNRFSAFYEAGATPEQFAFRYFDDVFNTFSKKDGTINNKLWDLIAPFDPATKSRVVSLTGPDGTVRVTPDILRKFGVKDSPQYVLGREATPIPTAGRMEAFYGTSWTWMGEQYARIAREPIFLGNYLEQREVLRSYERYLAANIGEEASKKTVAKIATERAYWFTLNYVDNPRNRSQLAWKVRNVSRYYRATEDFYRRAVRVGTNYPEGLWKTALTYQILDDTGYVFTDDNGDKFFAYPGNEQLQWVVNEFMGRIIKPGTSGVGVLPGNWTFDPFMIGGLVKMNAPSTDPDQLMPAIAGPMAALGVSTLFSLAPQLKGLERYVLGEYGQGASYWDLVLPAGIARVFRIMNPDEASSTYAGAIMDAMAIGVAEDLFPDYTEGGDRIGDPGTLYRTEVAETIERIAVASVVTRVVMGFFVPAAPRLYANNTSLFAKQQGWPTMRSGFLKLVQKYKDEPDPVKAAFQAWWRLSPNLMPYTISKTEDAPNKIEGRAELRPFDTVKKWYLTGGKELYENPRYGTAALFLAPRDGEFSPGAWNIVTSTLGLRQDRTFESFLRDAQAARGQFKHYATISDYQDDIDLLNPLDPAERKQISELEEQKTADLKWLREEEPYWELKWAQENESASIQVYARRLLEQTTNLVEDLKTKGEDTEESRAIRSAIMTFNDYMSDYEAITGNNRADQDRKRELRMDLSLDMELVAQRNPNVELFIKNVIRPLTPRGTGI
jgi:hypothetical protein